MSVHEAQYRFPIVLFMFAAFLRAADRSVRAAAKAAAIWLEKRRVAAAAYHDFEYMSERDLRDIGLSRADVNRVAWGAPAREFDPF